MFEMEAAQFEHCGDDGDVKTSPEQATEGLCIY